jgi:Ca2+-binding EF-hand superfamily protein
VCIGDCSGDGHIAIEELIIGVRIALGELALDSCAALDANGDGRVTIDELIRAVDLALTVCA